MVLNIILTIMAFLIMLLMITLLLNTVFYYLYSFKFYSFLKKNRTDLVDYVFDANFARTGKPSRTFQDIKNWHFGDLGEEDETVKYHMTRLKMSAKIGYIQLVLLVVITILLILSLPEIPYHVS